MSSRRFNLFRCIIPTSKELTHALQKKASLFNHLVDTHEHRHRHVKSQRFRGPQVDDELDLHRLLHWEIGRLLALENAAGVVADEARRVPETGSVAIRPPAAAKSRRS